jgi:hypothetical protein
MVKVLLPSQLTGLAGGEKCLEVQASTLGEVFVKVDEIAPMIRSQIFDASGSIRQFIGLFLDDRQIDDLGNGAQPVRAGSQLLVVMSVAGG